MSVSRHGRGGACGRARQGLTGDAVAVPIQAMRVRVRATSRLEELLRFRPCIEVRAVAILYRAQCGRRRGLCRRNDRRRDTPASREETDRRRRRRLCRVCAGLSRGRPRIQRTLALQPSLSKSEQLRSCTAGRGRSWCRSRCRRVSRGRKRGWLRSVSRGGRRF